MLSEGFLPSVIRPVLGYVDKCGYLHIESLGFGE